MDIEITQGTNKTFLLTVTDEDGVAVNLTGATIYFTVKKCTGTGVIAKVSTTITQIEIHDPTNGKAKIYLVPVDTATLELGRGRYEYDTWVMLASAKRYQVIEPSPFIVKSSVTVIP